MVLAAATVACQGTVDSHSIADPAAGASSDAGSSEATRDVETPGSDASSATVSTPDASTHVDPPAPVLITDIDFEGHAPNTIYDADLVDRDFRTYTTSSGPGRWGGSIRTSENVMIVEDPTGTRGMVMESRYVAGSAGGRFAAGDHFSRTHYNLVPVGGETAARNYPKSAYADSSFSAGRPPGEPGEQADVRERDPSQRRYDELYASVDMMFSPGFQAIPYHKLWGLNSGSPEQSSHGTTPCYNTEGYYGLLSWLLVTGREWDASNSRGLVGSMAMYEYNAEKIFITRWLNRNDYTVTDRDDMDADDFYIPPRGLWFTVEIHAKLNTADDDYRTVGDTASHSCGPGGHRITIEGGYRADHPTAGDLKDGIVEVWVTDPRPFAEGGTDGVPRKMYESNLRQRWWNYLKYTKFFMQDYSNTHSGTMEYRPDQDQYTYFDNIRVSESRIHP